MTYLTIIVLILLVMAMLAFSFEWIAAEVVALGLMLAFVVFGILSPEKAFAGFANDTVMMILGLLIMTAVLARTGLMQAVSRILLRATGQSPKRFLWLMMITIGIISSFMSNTAATAFFLPVVIGVARRLKSSESQFLLPLAFASILSSSVSLIATSTNLVVSGLMQNLGMKSMEMFELTPVGLPILAVGIIYLGTVGAAIMKRFRGTEETILLKDSNYTGELMILEKSFFAEKSIKESRLGVDHDIQILSVIRRKDEHLKPFPDLVLKAEDVILVEADHEALLRIKNVEGLELKAEAKLESNLSEDKDSKILEAIVLLGSTVVGKSLKETRFRDRHGVVVLGIRKSGRKVRKMSQVKLDIGDTLLLQGTQQELASLEEMHAIRLIGETLPPPMPTRKAWLISAIFIAALLVGILKIAPLPVAVLGGAFFMLATRVVNPDIIYREVEWKAVILIACMLSVGQALQASGTDKLIAGWLSHASSGLDPLWLLGGVFWLTVGLSQPMSNQAAAALILPIAVASAVLLGINPRAMAMMVAIAASCSFLTPLEPSCLMVYGPGNYRLKDFFIVGMPLTLIIFMMAILLVPLFWPL